MGDIIDVATRFNLTPFNTVLLCGLAFFIHWAIKGIFRRLDAIDGPQGQLRALDRKNQRQDLALARLEQRLDMPPMSDEER